MGSLRKRQDDSFEVDTGGSKTDTNEESRTPTCFSRTHSAGWGAPLAQLIVSQHARSPYISHKQLRSETKRGVNGDRPGRGGGTC